MKLKSALSAFLICVFAASAGFAETEKGNVSDAFQQLNKEFKAEMEKYSKKLDSTGKKMSLNDYRGKVVLLTFWGDW